MTFVLPPLPCLPMPHVHIEAETRRLRHQAAVGRNFAGRNGYGEPLTLTWHGIEEYPDAEFADLVPDPAIKRRLAHYVAEGTP